MPGKTKQMMKKIKKVEGGKEGAEESKLPEIKKSQKDENKGDTEVGEVIKLPRKEEDARAKDGGGNKASKESKLHEMKSSGNAREYNKRN